MTKIEIFYYKRGIERFSKIFDLCGGFRTITEDCLSMQEILYNYVKVDTVETDGDVDMVRYLEHIYHTHQGEYDAWGPRVQSMIRRLKTHTSMSMGDLVHITGMRGNDDVWAMVDHYHFKTIKPQSE